ncbi:MAG TPA: M56 family metallopeptidase, partial [Gemmataceae bacterium]|nr:M56 family metallopeptidase [Gemmataceae bacterium]
MTALGFQIGWLTIRVTLLALVATGLSWWCARRAARSAVLVLAAGVTIFLVLSVAAFCPMPDLSRWSPFPPSQTVPEVVAGAEPMGPIAPDHEPPPAGPAFSKAWHLLKEFSGRAPASPAWQQGGALLAALYGLGLAIASLRLLSGWLAVGRLRRRSRPISDAGLLALTDAVRMAVGCSRRLELRECTEPGLAATVGWRRPVVFLPPEWPDWTLAERQAVLAHELAHIKHVDYFIRVWTGVCQALYFYHPLVYWLSAQLRWQQELAADELAVSALDDRGQYLKALASLALRTPPRMAAGAMPWSALTGGTLLRRIHMLRGTRNCRPLGRTMRGLLVGLLAGVGLLLTTLGSSATRAERPTETTEPFEIGYLPADCQGFVGIRPAVFLKQPGMEKMGQLFNLVMADFEPLFAFWPAAMKAENLEQVVLKVEFYTPPPGKPGKQSLTLSPSVMRLNMDFDWAAYFKNLSKEPDSMNSLARHMFGKHSDFKFDLKEFREDGLTIYRVSVHEKSLASSPRILFHVPDARTLVTSQMYHIHEDEMFASFRQLIRSAAEARRRDWGTGFDKIAHAPLALVMDNHKQYYAKLLAKDKEFGENDMRIVEGIHFASLGIELGKGRPVRLVLDAKSAAAAPELAEAVNAYAGSLPEMVRQYKADNAFMKTTMKWVGDLLQSRQTRSEGAHLEWLGNSTVRVRDFFNFDPEKYIQDLLEKVGA